MAAIEIMKRLPEVEHWKIRERVSRAVGCTVYLRRHLECWSTSQRRTPPGSRFAPPARSSDTREPSDLCEDLARSGGFPKGAILTYEADLARYPYAYRRASAAQWEPRLVDSWGDGTGWFARWPYSLGVVAEGRRV